MTACAYNYTFGLLQFNYVHGTLKRKLVEKQPVAHIVIGAHCFGIKIDHYTPVTFVPGSSKRIYRTPVELNRTSDTVSARTKYYNRFAIFFRNNIMCRTIIRHVQIVGLSRIFGSKRVNLLDIRQDSKRFAVIAYLKHFLVHISRLLVKETCYLEIRETFLFRGFH